MKNLLFLAFAVCALLFGCSQSAPVLVETGQGKPLPAKSAFRLVGDFASDLPDPWEQTTGPQEAHGNYPVNQIFGRKFDELLRKKSTPTSSRQAEVNVHLRDLKTGYQEVGWNVPTDRTVRVALTDLGDLGTLGIFGLEILATSEREDLGEIPEQLTKSVAVVADLEVRTGGKTLHFETVEGKASVTLTQPEYSEWFYDYTTVIEKAIDNALAKIDGVLDEVL